MNIYAAQTETFNFLKSLSFYCDSLLGQGRETSMAFIGI